MQRAVPEAVLHTRPRIFRPDPVQQRDNTLHNGCAVLHPVPIDVPIDMPILLPVDLSVGVFIGNHDRHQARD